MYAIMGITGQVGSAVAEALLAKNKQVRAVLRNPQKADQWRERGAEIALADFNDAEALTAALHQVEGVFVMLPPEFAPSPGFPEARSVIDAVSKALLAARPSRAVYLSSIGAQRTSGLGLVTALHLLEEAVLSLPIPGASLRAGWFMENSLWDVPAARDQGKLFSYLQPLDKSFALVAIEDIGRIAAETLLEDWTGSRILEVAGPERYSPFQIAVAFAAALHRPVQAVAVPRATWQDAFVANGTPPDRTADRIAMLDGFNSGWIDFGVQGTERRTGTITLQEVITSLVSHPSVS